MKMQNYSYDILKKKKKQFTIKLLGILLLIGGLLASSTPEANILSVVGVCFFLFQVIEFIWLAGNTFPVRNLFCILMGMQMLVGPFLTYYWFPHDGAYYMRVPDTVYFSYAFPAMIAFFLGLRVFGLKSETIDIEALKATLAFKKNVVYFLIAIGLLFSFLETRLGSSLSFVFVLLGCLRYIGLFMLILTQKKFPRIETAIVYGLILMRAFSSGMFHDLLTWSMFLGIVLAMRYNPSFKLKLSVFILAVISVFLLQSIKHTYREQIYSGGDIGVGSLDNSFKQVDQQEGILSKQSISDNFVVRINQGWILSSALLHVPYNLDHTGGEITLQYMEAALLPRVLAPNKLTAGNQAHFMKYSGVEISESVSMGLGAFADAYIEFGIFGGWVYLFFYGMLYSLGLFLIFRQRLKHPYLVLFIPMIFLYPIRPDCELQTVLGHYFKSALVVYIFHQYIKSKLPTLRAKMQPVHSY